jgi:hypothetical protein
MEIKQKNPQSGCKKEILGKGTVVTEEIQRFGDRETRVMSKNRR